MKTSKYMSQKLNHHHYVNSNANINQRVLEELWPADEEEKKELQAKIHKKYGEVCPFLKTCDNSKNDEPCNSKNGKYLECPNFDKIVCNNLPFRIQEGI